MWNKKHRLLWFKLKLEHNKDLHLSFPIPLSIFQEILDCILDLITLASFFISKTSYAGSHGNVINNGNELIILTAKLLNSLTDNEPYDLLDITADKVSISLKIK